MFNSGLLLDDDIIAVSLNVYGTGDNVYYLLTGLTNSNVTTLTKFTGLPTGITIVKIYVIDSENAIALGSDGIVYGVGHNVFGQITEAAVVGSSFTPTVKTVYTPFTGLPGGVTAIGLYCFQYNTVVIGSDGVLYGTGRNDYGQLTDVELSPIDGSALTIKTTLTAFTGLPGGVTAVKVYAMTNCIWVLGSDGVVYGSGSNASGKLTGSGNRSTLTAFTGLPGGVTAVSIHPSTSDNTIVLGSNSLLYGTGSNSSGQLTGSGNKSTLTAFTGLPGGVTVASVVCGSACTLVIGSDGKLYGTGNNSYSQLSSTGGKTTLTAFTGLPGGVTVSKVITSNYTVIVLGSDGLVYGCGRNNYGQLTGASTSDKTTLTLFTGLPGGVTAVSIYAQPSTTVVLGSDGVVYGTGLNTNSILTGSGNKTTLTAFTGLPGGVTASKVYMYSLSSGGLSRYSIAILGSDGKLYGTGENPYGLLTGTAGVTKTTLTLMTGLPSGSVISDVITGKT